MKYTIDSPEFLAVYYTLNSKLRTTTKTCRTFSKDDCKDCIFDSNRYVCDLFVHLRETFNEKEFKEKYPELFI